MRFNIRLTEDISPYGLGLNDVFMIIHHAESLPFLHDVRFFTPEIIMPHAPEIGARINEQLQTWVDAFPTDEEGMDFLIRFGVNWSYWPSYILYPSFGQWRDYISVSYNVQLPRGGLGHYHAVFTISFDITTGETVNLIDIIPDIRPRLDSWQVSIININSERDLINAFSGMFYPFLYYNQGLTPPEYYTPPEGIVINDVWLIGSGPINIRFTEPDGRVMWARFSLDYND
jgi:hypothetical protein